MSDILEEVLNDQNDEKKLYYFRKALPIVILLTILTVVGIIIYDRQLDKKNTLNAKISNSLVQSMASNNVNSSIKSLSSLLIANKEDNRINEVVTLAQINLYINAKDYHNAKILLDKVINNSSYQEITTSYAKLLWLTLAVDDLYLSVEDVIKTEKYLEYFNSDNSLFFGTASILKAIWYANKNQPKLAIDTLQRAESFQDAPLIIKEQIKSLSAKINSK